VRRLPKRDRIRMNAAAASLLIDIPVQAVFDVDILKKSREFFRFALEPSIYATEHSLRSPVPSHKVLQFRFS